MRRKSKTPKQSPVSSLRKKRIRKDFYTKTHQKFTQKRKWEKPCENLRNFLENPLKIRKCLEKDPKNEKNARKSVTLKLSGSVDLLGIDGFALHGFAAFGTLRHLEWQRLKMVFRHRCLWFHKCFKEFLFFLVDLSNVQFDLQGVFVLLFWLFFSRESECVPFPSVEQNLVRGANRDTLLVIS